MSSYSPSPDGCRPASRHRAPLPAAYRHSCAVGHWHHDQYLDRTVLGIAAPKLTAELGIDPAIMGILFSAFAWTYALAQIPGGLFMTALATK